MSGNFAETFAWAHKTNLQAPTVWAHAVKLDLHFKIEDLPDTKESILKLIFKVINIDNSAASSTHIDEMFIFSHLTKPLSLIFPRILSQEDDKTQIVYAIDEPLKFIHVAEHFQPTEFKQYYIYPPLYQSLWSSMDSYWLKYRNEIIEFYLQTQTLSQNKQIPVRLFRSKSAVFTLLDDLYNLKADKMNLVAFRST